MWFLYTVIHDTSSLLHWGKGGGGSVNILKYFKRWLVFHSQQLHLITINTCATYSVAVQSKPLQWCAPSVLHVHLKWVWLRWHMSFKS